MSERVFKTSVRIYYEDTDFSGIVYHANYLKFFERGRSDALRACGVAHRDLLERDEPLVFAVRRMETTWRAPARIEDELEVCTVFQSVKGARLVMRQEIYRGDELLCEALVEAACMNKQGRPRRVDDEMLALLSGDKTSTS